MFRKRYDSHSTSGMPQAQQKINTVQFIEKWFEESIILNKLPVVKSLWHYLRDTRSMHLLWIFSILNTRNEMRTTGFQQSHYTCNTLILLRNKSVKDARFWSLVITSSQRKNNFLLFHDTISHTVLYYRGKSFYNVTFYGLEFSFFYRKGRPWHINEH